MSEIEYEEGFDLRSFGGEEYDSDESDEESSRQMEQNREKIKSIKRGDILNIVYRYSAEYTIIVRKNWKYKIFGEVLFCNGEPSTWKNIKEFEKIYIKIVE